MSVFKFPVSIIVREKRGEGGRRRGTETRDGEGGGLEVESGTISGVGGTGTAEQATLSFRLLKSKSISWIHSQN